MYVLGSAFGSFTVAWYIIPSLKHFLSKGHSLFLGQLQFLFSGSGGLRIFEFLAEMIWAIFGVVEYPIFTFFLLKILCNGW